MYRFLGTPRWVAGSIATLLAIAAFIGLGSWQWHRARTRDTPHAVDLTKAPPVPVAQALGPSLAVPAGTPARAVTAAGRYDAAHQVLVPGRSLDGRDGSYVLTPLLGVPGLGGHAVVVLRGWVPGRPSSAPSVPAGPVDVHGWLAPAEDPDAPVGAADLPAVLPAGQVATISTAPLLSLMPYRLVDGYVGLAAQTPSSTLAAVPAPPPPRPGIRWSVQSLAYTFEWWFFALAAVWMWVTAVRRERLRADAPPAPPGARPRTTRTG
ncbi:MAG TPA: SURF1 family protein [Actinomycetes bacterium]|nr:SURF1 family protein [Actinomycetes bacterium]